MHAFHCCVFHCGQSWQGEVLSQGRVRGAGEKRHLGWLRHYLVAATRGGQPSTAAGSAGAALHLYDLRNKLVAASLLLPEVRGDSPLLPMGLCDCSAHTAWHAWKLC